MYNELVSKRFNKKTTLKGCQRLQHSLQLWHRTKKNGIYDNRRCLFR